MKKTKAEKRVEELLVKIRKAVKNGNYIFRGENKEHDKISSKLYRYFQIIAGQAELPQSALKFSFKFIKKPLESELEKQLGESAKAIDFSIIEKSLKENILIQLAQKDDNSLIVESIQKDFILRDVQEYVDFENEIDTLTELQHYGGSTNLIDFSRDLAVALFFACDGEPKEDGRLILLSADSKGVIAPKKNQNNRIIFQKSVFVKRDKGYIEEKVKQFIVPKNLKPLLLAYVQNYFGIRTETVYGDLIGYIQNQERHHEAHKLVFAGVFYDHKEEPEKAIDCYTKAIKLKPNFADAYNNRGNVKTAIFPPNLRGAIIDYGKAIKLNPNYSMAYNNRGNAYSRKGDPDRAIIDFNKSIELNPNYANAYNNRGAFYGRGGDNDLALADFNKAIKLNPNYAEAYYNLGVTKEILNDTKGAKKDFQEALRLAKKQKEKELAADSQTKIDDLSDDSERNLPTPTPSPKAFITYSHKNADKRERLETALAVMINNGEIEIWSDAQILPGNKWEPKIAEKMKKSNILLYLVSADSLASKNCNKELTAIVETSNIPVVPIVLEHCDFLNHSLAGFNALPQKNGAIIPISDSSWKNSSEAWQNVVEGIRNSIADIPGKPPQGEPDIPPSTPKGPQPASPNREQKAAELLNHANFSSMLDNRTLALADYKKIIELNPNYADAYNNRGIVYANKGNNALALADFTKAIELNPNDAVAYTNRGAVYDNMGDYDRAIADHSMAINLNSKYVMAYYNRGNTYKNKGDYNLAIIDYNEVIELNPSYADAYYNRGIAKKVTQDYKGAKKDFEIALRLVKQQGRKDPVPLIQKEIDDLPNDSNS